MAIDRTLEELGWPEVTAALAARCRLPAGGRLAAALPFYESAAEVREALARVDEARALGEMRLSLPLGDVGDVGEHVDRAGKGGTLDPLALRACAALLRGAVRTRAFLSERSSDRPRLWALAEPLSNSASLADRIEIAIEPSGEISDRASPVLAGYRDRVRGLHRVLKTQVETYLSNEEMTRNLRDTYFTIRNDRYVLPVLSSARAAVPGIIHNASQSGQTLFVEPEGMVELGNELSIASAMVAEEEERILRELSEGVSARAGDLARDLALLARLDLLEASARLASDLDAHAPEVATPADGFELLSLRHPLLVLQAKKVVASNVRLVPPQHALIVSGPNGGGKTVAITAVGLSACMLRAGLPIPAAQGSRLPYYRQVRAAIDERGDLSQDLSTFTAHLTAVRDMAAGAGPGSLVLVDEIAADTDPREGAALASAILEDLVVGGAQVLVTTHLDELKALALGDPRFGNARVGFDAERLVPTYQVHLGTAGSSSALEVARRVGIAERIVERARAALTGTGGALGNALAALESERAGLAAERRGVESERNAARAAASAAQQREEAARRAEKEAEARIREQLSAEIEAARRQVSALLTQLQTAPTVRKASEAAAELTHMSERTGRAAAAAETQAQAGAEALPNARLAPGMRVRIISLRQDGELIEANGSEALVRVGPLKVRRKLSDLLALKGKAAPPPGMARGKKAQLEAAAEARPDAPRGLEHRLDVRGLRVEELLREVDRFLDRHYADGDPQCVILHGHGTGALKAALREHLAASPYVGHFRRGDAHEGGDAVTILTLRR